MAGNTFGRLFRVTTWGESHGPALGAVIDGCPPRLSLSAADIEAELARRRPGVQAHATSRREPDKVEILSGVFDGLTTGTPISLIIYNRDVRSQDYDELRLVIPSRPRRFHLSGQVRHQGPSGRRAGFGPGNRGPGGRRRRGPKGLGPGRHPGSGLYPGVGRGAGPEP